MNNNKFLFTCRTKDPMNRELYFSNWVHERERNFVAARKRSLGQRNIFAPVCHSVHRGGGRWSTWAGTPPPGQVHPLGRYTSAMHAGIRSTSGWYASYRNAFLLHILFQMSKAFLSKTSMCAEIQAWTFVLTLSIPWGLVQPPSQISTPPYFGSL